MAAPRKHIRILKTKEIEGMDMLWKTGTATREQMEREYNIKGDRLKKLCHSGYLEERTGKIVLGEKGIEKFRKEGKEYQYKTGINNAKHDIRLSEKYISLPKEIRETWKTEKQLHSEAQKDPRYDDFKKRIVESHPQGKFQPTPDGAVYSKVHGGYIAIEVTTRNYKENDIEQKQEFAKIFLSGYEQL
ncbi:hypothetical protein COK91_29045 [Bacillus cereus]|uniref:hypothetical protein n=1 Tax=Bacillus cereus TaxID=1396 RepID=UPI000BF75EBF|nr:hypothetical protein [Bacillus cereus]PFU77880.1 hypothetical protein COK91_29045 [Bacillus cereus]